MDCSYDALRHALSGRCLQTFSEALTFTRRINCRTSSAEAFDTCAVPARSGSERSLMEWAAAGILPLLMGCLMTQGACGAQGGLQSLTHDIDLGAVALITQIRSGLGAANAAERRWKGRCAELPGGRTERRGDGACLSAGGRRKVCQARRFVVQKGDRVDTSGRCSWLAHSPAQLQRRSAHVQRLAKLCGQTDSEHGGLPSVVRYQLKQPSAYAW